MAKKMFGATNFQPKDFKDKTALGKVETKRKPMIETASEETRKRLLGRKTNA